MNAMSGDCFRCKRGALLYPVISKKLEKVVHVCYECRELIKELTKKVAES